MQNLPTKTRTQKLNASDAIRDVSRLIQRPVGSSIVYVDRKDDRTTLVVSVSKEDGDTHGHLAGLLKELADKVQPKTRSGRTGEDDGSGGSK